MLEYLKYLAIPDHMIHNGFMSGDKSSSGTVKRANRVRRDADNQQETMYYFSGFFSGEGSISIIRATNKNGGSGFYYTPDMTISNADSVLLKRINQTIFCNKGVMTPIKGGYNLSLRGKNKVIIFLNFLKKYPPSAGDLIREKLALIKKAVAILLKKGNRNKRFSGEIESIEHIRQRLRIIKKTAQAVSFLLNLEYSVTHESCHYNPNHEPPRFYIEAV